MCTVSKDILDKLNITVEQFIQEGRLFTGYDVTVETRERENIKLRHEEVRGDIHDLPALKDEFEFGDYERHEINMPKGGWAWVYHKKGVDPNQYTPRGQQQKPAVTFSTSVVSQSAAIDDSSVVQDSGGKQDDGSFATDYRNRLMVAKNFLESAKLKPGDDCYVHYDVANSKLVLANSEQAGVSLLGTYRVERNGDIRLSSKTLQNLGTGNSFQIESENELVIVLTA